MKTMSIRVSPSEMRRIFKAAKVTGSDKSTAARTLIREGWLFFWIRQYRDNKVSLENLANNLELPLSEVIDLLAELGIEAPITYDDYVAGLKHLN